MICFLFFSPCHHLNHDNFLTPLSFTLATSCLFFCKFSVFCVPGGFALNNSAGKRWSEWHHVLSSQIFLLICDTGHRNASDLGAHPMSDTLARSW